MTLRALADRRQHHPALMGSRQGCEQLGVVAGAGAAAVAFEHQPTDAAVEQSLQLSGLNAWKQRQHRQVDRLSRLAIVQFRVYRLGALTGARAWLFGEGIEPGGAQLG